MLTEPAVHVALLGASSLTTAALAAYAVRDRRVQGAGAFAALALAFTVYSATHLFGLLTVHPRWRIVWEHVQWTGGAAIPVAWLAFALAYTGHEELLSRRSVAALSAVPAATVLLVWTNGWHGFVWPRNVAVVVDGLVIVDQTFGPWFWVNTAYTYAAVAVGAALLLRLVWLSDYLYTDQSALLVLGVTVPLAASVLTLLGATPVGDPPLDMTPYAFAVSGAAFGYALFRRRLFELVPATRQLGRNAAIAQLDDGVVIVDSARQVVYLNPAAADLFACDRADALGRPVDLLLEADAVDFATADALATVERDGRTYEVRTSPITDRTDDPIGHTLVVTDVTARERRARRLASKRAALETLDRINAVIRGVNEALVEATTREGIAEAVCERLTDSELYATAGVADAPTWRGDADRWIVAGEATDPSLPPSLADGDPDPDERDVTTARPADGDGTWLAVPLAYGRTVYGVLVLRTRRESVSDREREVLAELGGTIGHAVNAVETRRLLVAEAVVELEFASSDPGSPLVEASRRTGATLEVTGFVPVDDLVVYARVEGASAERVGDALAAAGAGEARTVRSTPDGGLVEATVAGDAVLGALADHGANLLRASAADGEVRVAVEVASGADVRALLEHVRHAFPRTSLVARRERDRAVERAGCVPEGFVDELTERQREALAAAYNAGYFDWPRESTAEEVAAALDISAPTLHGHLRKAEAALLTELFESGSLDRPGVASGAPGSEPEP